MVNQQLLSYINQELRKGRAKEDIKKTLSEMGWLDIYLEDAFNMVLNPLQHDLISETKKPDIAADAKAMANTQTELSKPAQTARQEVRDVFSQTQTPNTVVKSPDMPPVSRPQGMGSPKPFNGNVKVEIKNTAPAAQQPSKIETNKPEASLQSRVNPLAPPTVTPATIPRYTPPKAFDWDKVLLTIIIILPIVIIGLIIFWVLKR